MPLVIVDNGGQGSVGDGVSLLALVHAAGPSTSVATRSACWEVSDGHLPSPAQVTGIYGFRRTSYAGLITTVPCKSNGGMGAGWRGISGKELLAATAYVDQQLRIKVGRGGAALTEPIAAERL